MSQPRRGRCQKCTLCGRRVGELFMTVAGLLCARCAADASQSQS